MDAMQQHDKNPHDDGIFSGTGAPLPGQLWTTTLPIPQKVESIPMQVRIHNNCADYDNNEGHTILTLPKRQPNSIQMHVIEM